MKTSFEGIGQWAVTFTCEKVKAGQVVKLDGSGKAVPCEDGDAFCGTALAVARDGGACSVALGGMVSVPCSGGTPALGWSGLSADGQGGIKADGTGRVYLVAAADENAVTIVL